MKKSFFAVLAAAALVVAPVCLTSCDDESTSPSTVTVLKDLAEWAIATTRVVAKAPAADKTVTTKDGVELIVESLELTEAGKVILAGHTVFAPKSAPGVTRAAGESVVITGTYVILNGLPKIDLPINEEIALDGSDIIVDGKVIEGEKVDGVASADAKICRTWTVNPKIKVDGLATTMKARTAPGFELEKCGVPVELTITKFGTVAVTFEKADGSYNTELTTWKYDASGKFLELDQLLSIAFDQLFFSFTKNVTLGATVDGKSYEVYLSEK